MELKTVYELAYEAKPNPIFSVDLINNEFIFFVFLDQETDIQQRSSIELSFTKFVAYKDNPDISNNPIFDDIKFNGIEEVINSEWLKEAKTNAELMNTTSTERLRHFLIYVTPDNIIEILAEDVHIRKQNQPWNPED